MRGVAAGDLIGDINTHAIDVAEVFGEASPPRPSRCIRHAGCAVVHAASMRVHPKVAAVLVLVSMTASAQEVVNTYSPGPAFMVHGVDAGDSIADVTTHGFEVADVSGDGIPDLIIPTDGGDGPTNADAQLGEVHVVFGPFPTGGVQDLRAEPADVTIYGRDPSSRLGCDVIVADMDGDGANDLVVGAHYSRRPDTTSTRRGEACIFYGPLAPRVIDMTLEEPGACFVGQVPSDDFGASLAAGDVTGDGITDLLVGSTTARHGTTVIRGAVWILEGPLPPAPTRYLSADPPEVTIIGNATADFAWSLAVGDLSGDGSNDIVIGAPQGGSPVNGGSVHVLFGPVLPGTTVDLTAAPADVTLGAATDVSLMGRSVAIGDVNADGVPDLVAGAPRSERSGWPASGEVDVLLGPLTTGTHVDHVSDWPDVVFMGGEIDALGASVGAITLGSQQYLWMGAPDGTYPCGEYGQLFIFTEIPPSGTIIDVRDARPALTIGNIGVGDSFAATAFLTDIDGDDWPEIFATTWMNGPAGDRPQAGAVYLVGMDDYCEEPPPGLGPAGLHVRRSGDDVLLDFDPREIGREHVGVDVFRDELRNLRRTGLNTLDVHPGGCAVGAPSFTDVGGAAPGAPTWYYLATYGCPDACTTERLFGDLGSSSTGPRRRPGRGYDAFSCN
jgi:hypothetical protein